MTIAAPEVKAARRAVVAAELERLKRGGPLAFARVFLRHLVPGAWSPLHRALNAWHVREIDRDPGAQDAFAAPRGHGKSTAGVEIPALWHAAYCVRRFVVIASDTATQAEERLATVIAEVEQNEELRAAFPLLRPAIDDRGAFVKWTDRDVVFACGCRIVAVGAGKAIRGLRRGATRPDLLLLDDLEDEDSVSTDVQLDKRLRWILRVALGLAGPARGLSVLWLGTILSRRALLNRATGAALEEGDKRPEWARAWTPHVYRAELGDPEPTIVTDVDDDGTEFDVVDVATGKPLRFEVGRPLWSELSRKMLARIRYKLGAYGYAAEYLSDPVEEGTTLLAPPRLAFYVNPDAPPLARIVSLPGGRIVPVAAMTRACALDPQYAEPKEGTTPDLAAIVVAGQLGAETFLLDVWIGRDRHGQAARLVELGLRWSCYAGGVEAVAAQTVTADAAAADGRLPIVPLKRKPGEPKEVRALPLATRLGEKGKPETCRVWMLPDADRETDHGRLVEYLERFPHGRFDDPVDATVDAVDLASKAATRSTGGGSTPRTGGTRSA